MKTIIPFLFFYLFTLSLCLAGLSRSASSTDVLGACKQGRTLNPVADPLDDLRAPYLLEDSSDLPLAEKYYPYNYQIDTETGRPIINPITKKPVKIYREIPFESQIETADNIRADISQTLDNWIDAVGTIQQTELNLERRQQFIVSKSRLTEIKKLLQ